MIGLSAALLLAWPVVCLIFFALMRPRNAIVVSFFFAVLFLPMGNVAFSGFIDFNKYSATAYGVVFGILLFDPMRLSTLRLRWIDIPILLFTVSSLFSSLVNGLGVYDGLSATLYQGFTWCVPYFIGRLYFFTPEGMRFLARAIAVWGAIYIPFVLFEIRMSPQLHKLLYGYDLLPWDQKLKTGAFRSAVFMQHGLMVSVWLAASGLCALCLWQGKVKQRIAGIPMSLYVVVDVIFVLISRSLGAFMTMIGLIGTLFISRLTKHTIWLVLVASIMPTYITARAVFQWSPEVFTGLVEKHISEARASSFAFRTKHEVAITEKALRQPLFGYGGWGRGRVKDEMGKDKSITDSYWIIVFSSQGLIGLYSFVLMLLLPVLAFAYHIRARYWTEVWAVGGLALSLVVLVFSIDCLANAMYNPIYIISVGGLAGFAVSAKRRSAVPAKQINRPPGRNPHTFVEQPRV